MAFVGRYTIRMRLPLAAALVSLVALLIPHNTLAQSFTDGSAFTLSVSPQNPAPFSAVTVTPISGALEVTGAVMTISVNGKQIYQGSASPTNISVGAAGSVSTIKVSMREGDTNVSQTLSITPQDVSLIVEPNASSPALYPGKPGVPIGGTVRIVALANLRNAKDAVLDPSTLVYNWSVDGGASAGSGIGKSSLIVSAPLQYRNRTVSLAVRSQDGTLFGGDSVSFGTTDPIVRVYENNALMGIRFERSLAGDQHIAGSEVSLYAAPFGFPLANGNPTIEWFLNGVSAQLGNLITLRPTGDGQGSASLSVVASSGEDAQATALLPLTFGTKSSNFLGL